MAEENINSLYGGNYLKTTDIPVALQVECKIVSSYIQEFKDKKGNPVKKLVLKLESGKDFTLNKTNATRLAKRFGTDNYSQWNGKTFLIERDETEFAGNDVECLRVVKEAAA